MVFRRKIEDLKIIPLGGLGEVGKNMTVFEYKDDIVIIDIGLRFPEEDMPGIDYIIPNVSYLEGKQKNIRGVVFTHGHYDHIGAVPYLHERLGNPPMYATPLTRGIIIKRQDDFPRLPLPDITTIKAGDKLKFGDYFEIELIHVNHNIPESMALVIRTPVGIVFHTGDFKFDPDPVNDTPTDLERIKQIGDEGVLLLMSDSTGAEEEGHSKSEKTIFEEVGKIFKESPQMIVSGTFASLINRIQQLIQHSEKNARKVVFDGYSMKTNAMIAKELGYLTMQRGTEINIHDIYNYPRSKITVIATGAQGEGRAVLMRIANDEHKFIKIRKGDSVVFSSSVVPGNERTVQFLKDQLYRKGAKVYHYGMMDIHAGGHAQKEDLREMIHLIRPKFLMPIHGYYSMMVNHGLLAQSENIDEKNIIIADNGSIIHLSSKGWWFDKKVAPSSYVMVDGLGVGDVGNVVLRDRQVLAQDGMFVIVTLVDSKTGRVRGSPDIISRGFVYLKENKELLSQVRKRIKFIVEKKTTHPINWAYLKDAIRDQIGKFLFQKTERRPMILPVIIEV